MNHIIANKLSDLKVILEEPIYISGKKSMLSQEIYQNMWALTFTDDCVQKIQSSDLTEFLSKLIKKRTIQLLQINPKQSAIFYFWFDRQAFQLRFNIISGGTEDLPFGCKINLLDSPKTILEGFLTQACKIASEGEIVEFFEPGEDQDDDEAEIENYTLDVYAEELNPTKN